MPLPSRAEPGAVVDQACSSVTVTCTSATAFRFAVFHVIATEHRKLTRLLRSQIVIQGLFPATGGEGGEAIAWCGRKFASYRLHQLRHQRLNTRKQLSCCWAELGATETKISHISRWTSAQSGSGVTPTLGCALAPHLLAL